MVRFAPSPKHASTRGISDAHLPISPVVGHNARPPGGCAQPHPVIAPSTRIDVSCCRLVEALEQRLQILMAGNREAQHLALPLSVEALDQATGLRRVGLGLSV